MNSTQVTWEVTADDIGLSLRHTPAHPAKTRATASAG